MSILPLYTHIINPKLKHIYLSFDQEGNLVIKSPKVPLAQIEKILLKKASWIQKSKEKLLLKKGKPLDFAQNSELYFLGKVYPITLLKHENKRTKLLFDNHTFTLQYHNFDTDTFQRHIDTFYKKEAQHHIPAIVEEWSDTMNLTPQNISFRKTKRQWGSCSSKNVLSFNTMMMKLPMEIIHYIVVHELSHIRHKHHQEAFWKLVENYLPDYKIRVNELKNYTT